MHRCFPGTTLTVVIERPVDAQELNVISKALALLEPYITGMSSEDTIRRAAELERQGCSRQVKGLLQAEPTQQPL